VERGASLIRTGSVRSTIRSRCSLVLGGRSPVALCGDANPSRLLVVAELVFLLPAGASLGKLSDVVDNGLSPLLGCFDLVESEAMDTGNDKTLKIFGERIKQRRRVVVGLRQELR